MFHRLAGGISQSPRSGTSSAIRGRLSGRVVLGRIGAAVALTAATIGIGVCGMGPARSQVRVIQDESVQGRQISVTRDKSRTIKLDKPFASALVGAPDIADVLPMSDRVMYVQGKKVGTTNVTLFDKDKNVIGVIGLDVTIDVQDIASKVHAGTESPGIRVSSNHFQIVLSGVARDAVDAEKAVAIAKGMATPPEGKDPDKYVVNAMRIAASQQVMLRVRFIEVSRQAEREIGVNWFGANASGTRGINTGKGVITQAGPTASSSGVPVFGTLGTFAGSTLSAPFGVGLFNLANKGGSVDVLITALEQKGLARRLAEPDLVALSGDTASFLAGGEYPVPTVQPGGTLNSPNISTKYQPFGVQLTFVPTVLASGIINLRLTPSVSELDYANAVQISGTFVPALTKREARTTIELRDGQSFAIAGLLQSDNLRDVSQLPWVGSVPILGALFRSSSYQQKETDLVVIVTPHLVAPAAPGQTLATPFDKQLPGNDVDLFLMGRPEVRKQYTDYLTSGGEQKGPYGHMMPLEPK